MEYNQYEDKRSNNFATASMILGIAGLATGCCVYTSIICGALAVIFALLSRGGERTMSSRAKAGLGLGIAGIVCGILMIVAAFVVVIVQYGSFENYMNHYMELYEQLLGGYGLPQAR
jgi:hypothetical protein